MFRFAVRSLPAWQFRSGPAHPAAGTQWATSVPVSRGMSKIKRLLRDSPIPPMLLRLMRPVYIVLYLRRHRTRKLHIGAGTHLLDGWLNADRVAWVRPYLCGRGILLDARRSLPFRDGTFDYVFSEHMIEHIGYREGLRMLRECYRVLKPRGRIRIATPDLRQILSLYDSRQTEEQQRYLQWAVDKSWSDIGICEPAFVINNFFRKWGHQFIYDRRTLEGAMEQAGFVEVGSYAPGDSWDAALCGIDGHAELIGGEMNQFETMILEARRP